MHLGDAFLDLLLGGSCAGCGRPGRRLCVRCAETVAEGQTQDHWPDPVPEGLPRLAVTGSYEGLWPTVLAEYKEHRAWGLARPLATRLWPAVARIGAEAEADCCVLVPMPSRAAAVRERGHDTTAVLARAVSRIAYGFGWSLPVVRALRVARPVADSAGLGATQRMENLHHAIAVRSGALARLRRCGAAVVLCDDLVTTGASMTEATRALTSAGIEVAGGAAIVATRRHREGSPTQAH